MNARKRKWVIGGLGSERIRIFTFNAFKELNIVLPAHICIREIDPYFAILEGQTYRISLSLQISKCHFIFLPCLVGVPCESCPPCRRHPSSGPRHVWAQPRRSRNTRPRPSCCRESWRWRCGLWFRRSTLRVSISIHPLKIFSWK